MYPAPRFALPFLLSSVLLASTALQAQNRRNDDRSDRYDRYDRYDDRRYDVQRAVYRERYREVIPYHGYSYYYNNGYFYRPYGASVEVVIPPVGIRVRVLPSYYRPVFWGTQLFFYFDGIFYRQRDKEYEVVEAPVGAEVPELPKGARVVVIDNNKFYRVGDTYYKETIRSNGEIWYTVVGKHGVVSTAPAEVPMGTLVTELPKGCRVVVISGQKYYVAPNDTYYQEVVQNGTVLYKIVGNSN